jgi:hypothetical protein
MASATVQPSLVELWGESAIPKPEPLRIVKERSKTVAGDDGEQEVLDIGVRHVSVASARTSPPTCRYKNPTIRKRRGQRGSILDNAFDSSEATAVSFDGSTICEFASMSI